MSSITINLNDTERTPDFNDPMRNSDNAFWGKLGETVLGFSQFELLKGKQITFEPSIHPKGAPLGARNFGLISINLLTNNELSLIYIIFKLMYQNVSNMIHNNKDFSLTFSPKYIKNNRCISFLCCVEAISTEELSEKSIYEKIEDMCKIMPNVLKLRTDKKHIVKPLITLTGQGYRDSAKEFHHYSNRNLVLIILYSKDDITDTDFLVIKQRIQSQIPSDAFVQYDMYNDSYSNIC
jgi:hypothetical protein